MTAPTCPTCGRLLGAGDIGMGICVRCGALLGELHRGDEGRG